MYVRKQYSDEKFDQNAQGRLFNTGHYKGGIVTEDTDCYWIDENEKSIYCSNSVKGLLTVSISRVELNENGKNAYCFCSKH